MTEYTTIYTPENGNIVMNNNTTPETMESMDKRLADTEAKLATVVIILKAITDQLNTIGDTYCELGHQIQYNTNEFGDIIGDGRVDRS